jgi:hypothetical protein
MGSDRPTPRGSGGTLPIDDGSSVVAKVFIVGREDARLLWVVSDIDPLGFRPGSFYRSRTRLELERKCGGIDRVRRIFHEPCPRVLCGVFNGTDASVESQFAGERSLDMM